MTVHTEFSCSLISKLAAILCKLIFAGYYGVEFYKGELVPTLYF